MLISILTSFIILLADQLLKAWTIKEMPLNSTQPMIPNLIKLHHIRNEGAGWGIFAGQRTFLIIVTMAFLFYLVYLIWRNRHAKVWTHLAYGFILGGTVGNLIDRLRQGYVVDMLEFDFIDFPIFNLADIALSLGIILIFVIVLFNLEEKDVL